MNRLSITPRRASPDVSGMFVHRARDGTIWAFESEERLRKFIRKGGETRKSSHFLSPREALSQSLGLTNIYES